MGELPRLHSDRLAEKEKRFIVSLTKELIKIPSSINDGCSAHQNMVKPVFYF